MSISTILPVGNPAVISKFMTPLAFTEYRDLVLGTLGLATGSYITMDSAICIWVHEQPFCSWQDAWKWVCQIQNPTTRRTCAVDLVSQKIRSLNAVAKSGEEISSMVQKNFAHVSLEKKESTFLRDSLDGYIKAVSYSRFSLPS